MANELLGKPLSIKGQAILIGAPSELLSGLDPEDQAAIVNAVGQAGTLADILADGSVEFELQEAGGCRTIWIDPKHLLA